MNAFTDNATKTLTGTKALIALGSIALVISGAFIFAFTKFVKPLEDSGDGGAPPIALTSCRTITVSGSYYLTQNLTAPLDNNCFYISANDVTLDGNNKTVTVNKTNPTNEVFAVEIRDLGEPANAWHNITVRNMNSNSGVRVFGDSVSGVTFDHLNVWQIHNLGGDYVTISYNTVGAGGILVSAAARINWRPMHSLVRYNNVTGGLPEVSKLVEVAGTNDLSDPNDRCPRLDTVIDHNTITATHTAEPNGKNAAYRTICATHVRFTNNTLRSTGLAAGLHIRDEADDGLYENNQVVTNTRAALFITDGNPDKIYSARNIFRHNSFRTEAGQSIYTLGIGAQNVFTDNTFYSNDPNPSGSFGSITGNTYNHNTFYNAATTASTFALWGNRVAGPPNDSFTNNIISYSGPAIFSYDGWQKSLYAGDYNLFHNRGGSVSFGNLGASLEAWKATSPASDAHSIEANPLFTNPPAGDFSTPTNSPAHNKASDGTDIGARR